ncbi:hypothetical protein KDA82_35650, partial [Streptomyces daliensis]|nr:hypothetical protein [Streptomyces daliensis]
ITLLSGMLPAAVREGTRFADGSEGIGVECAGVVTACGPGVDDIAVGDRVAGMADGSLASHTVLNREELWRMAEHDSFAECAALPVAVTTVQYGLGQLARIRRGETVLVHGAAGGVGLAAIYYARLKGAHVIATAGSGLKRDFLRALGVPHVLDSRT